jgi:two-component system response regulator NreC
LNISSPKLKILIVSVIDSEEIVLKTIKAGAKGFLGKDSDRNSLLEAIYTLRNGYDYYSKSITHLLLNRYISSLKSNELSQNADLNNLSSRQIEILKLWGESYTNQEIADRLFVSINTIKKHAQNIFTKLKVDSRAAAVAVALKSND